jgi:hypothetical protein
LGKLLDQDELTAQDRQRVAELFAPVMKELLSASRCSACRWKHKIREEGMRAKLPYLSDMRLMARAVGMTIRQRAISGDFDGALSGLQVGLAMARHLENDAVTIQALVAVSIDRLMLDELEQLIQQPGSPNLYWALTTLPRPMRNMQTVMQWDRGWLLATSPALRDPSKMTRAQWDEVRESSRAMKDAGAPLPPIEEQLTPASKEVLLRSGLSEEQIAAMEPWRANAISAIDEYWRLESEIWKCWMLPGKQAAEEHAQAVQLRRLLRSDRRDAALVARHLGGGCRAIDRRDGAILGRRAQPVAALREDLGLGMNARDPLPGFFRQQIVMDRDQHLGADLGRTVEERVQRVHDSAPMLFSTGTSP